MLPDWVTPVSQFAAACTTGVIGVVAALTGVRAGEKRKSATERQRTIRRLEAISAELRQIRAVLAAWRVQQLPLPKTAYGAHRAELGLVAEVDADLLAQLDEVYELVDLLGAGRADDTAASVAEAERLARLAFATVNQAKGAMLLPSRGGGLRRLQMRLPFLAARPQRVAGPENSRKRKPE